MKRNSNITHKAKNQGIQWKLLPLQFILVLLPLITYYYYGHSGYTGYGWNSVTDDYHDFFLHYKMIAFTAVAAVMLVGVVLKLKKQGVARCRKHLFVFAPLLVYLLCLILSTVFSENYALSFLGAMDQKEPFFVLFGYVITVLYAYLVLETEEDLQNLAMAAVLGAFLMAVTGVLQTIGHDPFQTLPVQRMIADNEVLELYGSFVLNFPKGMAYGTLYNPNYVGTYVSMYLPLLLFGVLCGRALWQKICCAVSGIGLLVLLFASQSRTGLIAVASVLFILLIFSFRYVMKKWYIFVTIAVVGMAAFLGVNALNDSVLTNRLIGMFRMEKQDYVLKGIDTTGNGVKVYYKDTEFTVQMPVSGDGFAYVVSERGEKLPVTYSEDRSWAYTTLAGGEELSIKTAVYEDVYAFGLQLDGREWFFTNQYEAGNYLFINEFGRVDECRMPENALTGYDAFASSRGYSWGRTIPLFKEHIFIGSGPDTFAIAFPQNDYVARYRTGNTNVIFTRPHNFYLQMGVQTGVISLLAFLVFYMIYFVECCRLYFFRRFKEDREWMGFAFFLATIGFMASGFANDSLIVVSPVFYLLLGAGMAINKMNKKAKEDK